MNPFRIDENSIDECRLDERRLDEDRIDKFNSSATLEGYVAYVKDIDMYFINTLSCCVSMFSFGREMTAPADAKTDR